MHRRQFLKTGGSAIAAAAGLSLSGRLWAAPPGGPRLLVVFLRGGYDSANLLVPYSSPDYYELRHNIAIARPDPAAPAGALALDADWALAPAARATLGRFYADRQLAFIPFAGTEDLTRSHFETQDSIELGQPEGGTRDYRSGFLARLAATLSGGTSAGAGAIAFTDALPLIFQGPTPVPNLSLKNLGKPVFDPRQARLLGDLYAGHHLSASVSEGLELRQEVAQSMMDEMRSAGRDAITSKGFELEAERMGRLMNGAYRIGFIDVGGWDTHVNEGATEGALATNLNSVGLGLASFARTLGDQWQNTVVVVLSEFGRTFRENGNRGTDHGHGTVYWVLGGAVRGGQIAGEQRRVQRATLFQDRDYPVLNNYRAVLGGLFRSLWGLSAERSEQVFPAAAPINLHLI